MVQKTIVQLELFQAEEGASRIAVDTLSGSSLKLFILLYCHSDSVDNFTLFIFPRVIATNSKV